MLPSKPMMALTQRPARPPSVLLGPQRSHQHRPRRFAAAAATSDQAAAAAIPHPPAAPRALQEAARLAASRLAESRRGQAALFNDPYAALLARADGEKQPPHKQQEGQPRDGDAQKAAAADAQEEQQQEAALDAVATRYLDECLINATGATSVTRTAKGEDYRQVVLLGVDGGDCRPFRLPWPEGTVVFLVAPAEVHERAEALLSVASSASSSSSSGADDNKGLLPARVPRGCLLRRVDLDTAALQRAATGSGSADGDPAATIFMDALSRAGFRGDRLSVWGLQGLQGLGLRPSPSPWASLSSPSSSSGGGSEGGTTNSGSGGGRGALAALLAEVSSCAAFHSLVAGELPGPLSAREGSNLLAEAGLLASVEPPGGAGTRAYGRVAPATGGGGGETGEQQHQGGGDDDERAEWPRLFFSAQQLRPSLEQMGIYSSHVDAMEGSDEDFGTMHFS